jgi:hypothetical protein
MLSIDVFVVRSGCDRVSARMGVLMDLLNERDSVSSMCRNC